MNDANKQRANSAASNQKPANEQFPESDPSGDKTVSDLINQSKNPEV
jgi:hypothetical protein